ncbi:MAG: methionine biosynthesis protein MetW, partial [Actinomycetota bacterium]
PDPAAYISRVRAEIEAEAETLRRQDPELARRERDLERAWVDVAPPGAAGEQRELLLDRADRLAMIDVDAPVGVRPGVRQIKGAIRKGTYWYLRYVTDQINALTNVLVRLLRRLDDRLSEVEDEVGLSDTGALIDAPAQPGPAVAAALADLVPDAGRTIVLSCGEGSVVAALGSRSGAVVGIDRDPLRILDGVKDGLDLRAGDPRRHLTELPDDSLDTLVLAGFVEELPPAGAWSLLLDARRVVVAGGTVAVVAADPSERSTVEADLRRGRGIAPATWAHLLSRAGADVVEHPVDDPRHRIVVVGHVT